MSVEAKENIQQKLAESRLLLSTTADPAASEALKTYIEELEARLLTEMSKGPD